MSTNKTKIGFIGNFEYNCGSSNTVLGYFKAGKKLNIDIRLSEFGFIDKEIKKKILTADKKWNPDLMIVVYESYPFLSTKEINEICNTIPRKKLLILDPDGKYQAPQKVRNDENHKDHKSYESWVKLYDSISDVILQPTLNTESSSKIKSFLYFGIDAQTSGLNSISKNYDLVYVGNNWYRWDEMKLFLASVTKLRVDILKNIKIYGNYWDSKQMSFNKKATKSDPQFLHDNNIMLGSSVPYGHVEQAMSQGRFNPVFTRPILSHLQFITPRMFETINADTIPLMPISSSYLTNIFGHELEHFIFKIDPTEKIVQINNNYDKYMKIKNDILKQTLKNHSYESRIKELLNFI